MALTGIISNGTIVLFVGGEIPPEYAFPVTFSGDQPIDQKQQKYPQCRALLVVHDRLDINYMGVNVDELMQP